MKKFITRSLAAAAVAATIGSAQAAIVLDFEGTGNITPIGDFYNGGAGTNYGISFGADALSINGPSNNEALLPSGVNGLFFLNGSGALMNVSAGFTTGFSFYYSAPFYTGEIQVFDGLDGTGNLLASLTLPMTTNGASISECNNMNFCPYYAIGVAFSGTAKSVNFGGVANQVVFDDVTIGSITAGDDGNEVPEPGILSLIGIGIAGFGLSRRKRAA